MKDKFIRIKNFLTCLITGKHVENTDVGKLQTQKGCTLYLCERCELAYWIRVKKNS